MKSQKSTFFLFTVLLLTLKLHAIDTEKESTKISIDTGSNSKTQLKSHNENSPVSNKHPLKAAIAKKKRHVNSRMNRALYMEKLENPNYSELFAGKGGLDHEYMKMIDDQKSLEDKMKKQQAGLYQQYRRFEQTKNSMKAKRNAKLKKILQAATMDNFFTTDPDDLVSNDKNSQVRIDEGGLSLHGHAERQAEKMMGMEDLHDLKHLDIDHSLNKRIERVGKPEDDGNKKIFNSPRERQLQLEDQPNNKKSMKKVKTVVHPSFLLRNQKGLKKSKKGVFGPQKGLVKHTQDRLNKISFMSAHNPVDRSLRQRNRRTRRRRRARTSKSDLLIKKKDRKLFWWIFKPPPLPKRKKHASPPGGSAFPYNLSRKKRNSGVNSELNDINSQLKGKKSKKIKSLKKKWKKEYLFNWKTMRWFSRTKYHFELLESIKDLPFWRQMGFRLTKPKLKLQNPFVLHRKPKTKQMKCFLTAKFGKMDIYHILGVMFFKVTFNSNCAVNKIQKVFQGKAHHSSVFRISIANYTFTLTYDRYYEETKGYWRKNKKYNYTWVTNRKYSYLKVFPKYNGKKPHDPWRITRNYIRAGLMPKIAIKWKGRVGFWRKYQWAYPLRTYKQGKAYVAYLKRLKAERIRKLLAERERLIRLRRERLRRERLRRMHSRHRRYNHRGRRGRYLKKSRMSKQNNTIANPTQERKLTVTLKDKNIFKKQKVQESDFAKENTPQQIEAAIAKSQNKTRELRSVYRAPRVQSKYGAGINNRRRKLRRKALPSSNIRRRRRAIGPNKRRRQAISKSVKQSLKNPTKELSSNKNLDVNKNEKDQSRQLFFNSWRRRRAQERRRRQRRRRRRQRRRKRRIRRRNRRSRHSYNRHRHHHQHRRNHRRRSYRRYYHDRIGKYYKDFWGRKIYVNTLKRVRSYKNPYRLTMGGFKHYRHLGDVLLPSSPTKPSVGYNVIQHLWKSNTGPVKCKPGNYWNCKV